MHSITKLQTALLYLTLLLMSATVSVIDAHGQLTSPGKATMFVWTVEPGLSCESFLLDSFGDAMDFWNVTGPVQEFYELYPYDNFADIDLDHPDLAADSRFLALHTASAFVDDEAWYAAEWYQDASVALNALDDYYINGPYVPDEIGWGTSYLGQTVIAVSNKFIRNYWPSLDSDAIVDLSFAFSNEMAGEFMNLGGTAISGFDFEPWGSICDKFADRWSLLACFIGDDASTIGIANLLTGTTTLSNGFNGFTNSINRNYSCENWGAKILDWRVEQDGRAVFATNYERNSSLFEVNGHRNGKREVLARIRPKGDDSDRINVYEALVSPGYDAYSIAEIDSARMYRTLTDEVPPGVGPTNLLLLEGLSISGLGRTDKAAKGAVSCNTTPAIFPADAMIYAWNDSVAQPLYDQLTSQGLSTVYVCGFGNPLEIDAYYNTLHNLNVTFNAAFQIDIFPVWPGPELYLVGKHSQGTVSVNTWSDDEYARCGQPLCRGDFDYTDVDGDGIPNGPVARIFADDIEDIRRYVHFSNEYNDRSSVVRDRALLCDGSEVEGVDPTKTVSAVWLSSVESVHQDDGRETGWLRRRDYSSANAISSAAQDTINAGVDQIWAMGPASSYKRVPSSVFYGNGYDAELLTTDQSYLLFAPGCEVAADWGFGGSFGLILEKLMTNDMNKGGCAGALAHWSGAWGSQHAAWADYLLKAYDEATSGMSMVELVWRAAIDCTNEQPWMVDYCRSAIYVGARTLLKQDQLVAVQGGPGGKEATLALDLRPSIVGQGGCMISFATPSGGEVHLSVFDVRGRRVRTLAGRPGGGARQEVYWDGRSDSGISVASGVYFVRLEAGRLAETRKVILLH